MTMIQSNQRLIQMTRFLCKERWARLFDALSEAFYSFWYDLIIIEEDLPAHHGFDIANEMERDLQTQFESYRNFPTNRGFEIVLHTASGRWQASDGESVYWLNNTNNRWICVEGPDLDRPQKDNGDVIGNVE